MTVNDEKLIQAAKNNNIKEVKNSLILGADINSRDGSGQTALMYACEYGHRKIAKHLLNNGADINAFKEIAGTNTRITALHLAIANNQPRKIIKLLLDKKPDINQALNLTAFKEDEKIFSMIMEHKDNPSFNVDSRNIYNRTALMQSIISNKSQVITEKLIDAGADVNATNYNGSTPLIYAAYNGNEKIVEKLVAAGADVNAKDNNGTPPLIYAAHKSNEKIVEICLEKANQQSKDTALFYAVNNDHPNIVEKLVAAGADVNAKDTKGKNAIDYALDRYKKMPKDKKKERNEILKILIDKANGIETDKFKTFILGQHNDPKQSNIPQLPDDILKIILNKNIKSHEEILKENRQNQPDDNRSR